MAHTSLSSRLLLLALCLALPRPSSSVRFVEDDPAAKPPENSDRLQCLRQDELDLVIPSSNGDVLRMVLGLGGDTGNDAYLSAKSIWAKKISARAIVSRYQNNNILVQLQGADGGLGKIDAWLNGFDLVCKNSLMDAGASAAADRKLLAKGQPVRIDFKLAALGELVHDEELDMWNVVLDRNAITTSTYVDFNGDEQEVDADPDVFKLTFENQRILQASLNNFGKLDKLISDALFGAVVAAIPKGLIGSMAYIDKKDLTFDINVDLEGTSEVQGGPLQVAAKATIHMGTDPAKLLKTMTDRFEPRALARRQFERLWEKYDLEDMLKNNVPKLKSTLKRFGVNDEQLAGLRDVQGMRDALQKSAENSADGLVRALKPFMASQTEQDLTIFEGLDVATQIGFRGNLAQKTQIVTMTTLPGAEHVVSVPPALTRSIGPLKQLAMPKAGSGTELAFSNMKLTSNNLQMPLIELTNLRVRVKNESSATPQAKIYNINGRLRDASLVLPASYDMHSELHNEQVRVEYSPEGRLRVKFDDKGWVFVRYLQDSKAAVSENVRVGLADAIDGAVPSNLARLTEPAVGLDLMKVLPDPDFLATFKVQGHKGTLAIELVSKVQTSLNLEAVLKPLMAARPTDDFGYTFQSQKVRWLNNEKAQATFAEVPVVAIVSCGYLRLLKQGRTDHPLDRVKMEPSNGQLHIDLALYTVAPEVESGTSCILLYGSGIKPRKAGGFMGMGSRDVTDKVCPLPGKEAQTQQLLEAITLQIQRFRDDPVKAAAWKYGTHMVNRTMYKLPGVQTIDLTSIVDSA